MLHTTNASRCHKSYRTHLLGIFCVLFPYLVPVPGHAHGLSHPGMGFVFSLSCVRVDGCSDFLQVFDLPTILVKIIVT